MRIKLNEIRSVIRELLLELLNKDAAKTALDNADKSKYFDKILDLDPTKDKNAVYSIKLTKFFLEPRSQSDDQFLELLKSYFEKYLLFKNRKLLKGKDADLNSIKSFKDFHNLIDATEAELKRNKPVDVVAKIAEPEKVDDQGSIIEALGKKIDKKDITYVDQNVIVVRADNSSKSKRYGGGFSNWCTARKSGNLFNNYRFEEPPQTMFYVYFLNKNKNDNELVLHFGVDEDRDISYTDRLNKESRQTLDWLVRKFPELKPALASNAFKLVPLTATEIRVKKLPDKLSVEQFNGLSYDEKEMWFQSGDREVTLDIWNLMDENFKNLYVREFSDREDDIDNEIFNIIKGTKYEKLYMEGIQERIEDRISESETHTIDKPSPHDIEFIKTSPGLINKFNVNSLLNYSSNKDEMAKIILQYKRDKLSDDNVYSLLHYSPNKDEIAKILGPENINKLSDYNVYSLLHYSPNKDEMAKILGPENINKLSDNNVNSLLNYSSNKDEMAKIILQYKRDKLSDDNVYSLLHYSPNKDEIAKILGPENINKLSDYNVYSLLCYLQNKDEMAKILRKNLSSDRIEQYKLKYPQQAKWFNASPTPIRERHSNYKSYYS